MAGRDWELYFAEGVEAHRIGGIMTNTKNYQLNKPGLTDTFSLSTWNDNMDKIDTAVREAEKKGGSMILWRGALMAGGSAEFNVPEECFHNNGTTLTLLVDGYYRKGVAASELGKNLDMTGATLCFGSAGDFGLTDHASDKYYAPYADDEGNAYVKIYRNDSVSSDTNAYLNMTIKAKKVPDTRHAVCTIAMNSDKYFNNAIVTCVSAIAPAEMEA